LGCRRCGPAVSGVGATGSSILPGPERFSCPRKGPARSERWVSDLHRPEVLRRPTRDIHVVHVTVVAFGCGPRGTLTFPESDMLETDRRGQGTTCGAGRVHLQSAIVNVTTVGAGERRPREMEIRWGTHPTPFGLCLLAIAPEGICELTFLEAGSEDRTLDECLRRWPMARFVPDPFRTSPIVSAIFEPAASPHPIRLLLKGSEFQVRVWRALIDLPPGRLVSYAELARSVGMPSAARAVGNAVGANRIALVVPCHRVVRSTGSLGNYRWGTDRKRSLLQWEGLVGVPGAVARGKSGLAARVSAPATVEGYSGARERSGGG